MVGLFVYNVKDQRVETFEAKAVFLAGGIGQIYQFTTTLDCNWGWYRYGLSGRGGDRKHGVHTISPHCLVFAKNERF